MSELAAWDSFYVIVGSAAGRADWITVRSGDADRAKADASGTGRLGCVWHTDHRPFQRRIAASGVGSRSMARDHHSGIALGCHRIVRRDL